MKKIILLLLVLFSLTLFFGCVQEKKDFNLNNLKENSVQVIEKQETSFFPFKAKLKIIDFNYVHSFDLYSDGNNSLAIGVIDYKGELKKARLYFNSRKSFLYRESDNVALEFNSITPLYGFIPVKLIIENNLPQGFDLNVIKKENNFPVEWISRYKNKEYKIILSDLIHSTQAINGIQLSLPENTKFIKEEDYVIGVK